jgi:xylulose-5-phosphate/fructose-6-phosphate phosphoketolase
VLARISREELEALFVGYGYTPYFVEGDDPAAMHHEMAAVLEQAIGAIRAHQEKARGSKSAFRPRWPMIVLRTPKGWTWPKEVKGHKVEGSWRSHQVPFSNVRDDPANLKLLEDWMRSYKPDELFDANGALRSELRDLAPRGNRA